MRLSSRTRCGALALAAVLGAPAAFAAEFSVRLADVPAAGVTADVHLVAPCTPYDCGLEALSGRTEPPAAFATRKATTPGNAVIRGKAPTHGRAWWVVVHAPDRLPLALLWRVSVTDGHLPPAPRVESATCRLEVTSDAGDAVGGARVVPRVVELPPALAPPLDDREAVFEGYRPWLPALRTDERGRAALRAPAEGQVLLHVYAPGYRSATAPCEPNGHARLRLVRASTRTVTVRGPAGHGLEDALVRDALGFPVARIGSDEAVELDPGRADVAGPWPFWLETENGAVFRLVGHLSGQRDESPAPDGASGDMPTLQASELSRVRSGAAPAPPAGGAPGAEPSVWLWLDRTPPWQASSSRAASPLVEVSNGAWSLNALPGDRLWFTATGASFASCREPERGERRAAAASSSGYVGACPRFEPAPRIEALVVDSDGFAVPDAEVWVTWALGRGEATIVQQRAGRERADRERGGRRGDGSAFARSDESGRFVLRHVPLNLVTYGGGKPRSGRRVRVARPPYLPVADKALESFGDGRTGYRITLSRGVEVSGRVLSAVTSEPLADAEIALGRFAGEVDRSIVFGPLESRAGEFGQRVRTARTDTTGRFRLSAWPGRQDLVARAPGHAFFMLRDAEPTRGHWDAGDILLAPGAQIRGVVVDEAGAPVVGASVRAAGAVSGDALSGHVTEAGPTSRVAARFSTDAGGEFVVPGLPAESKVDLEVSAAGFATMRLPGTPPTGSRVLEVRLAPEAVISGEVTLGSTGVQTEVEVIDGSGWRRTWQTDEAGRFRTAGLAEGRYNLVAYPPGAAALVQDTPDGPRRFTVMGEGPGEETRASADAQAGTTTEIRLDLGAGERQLFGTVTENGVGLSGVVVRVAGRSAVTAPDGSYLVDGLPSGLAFVTAERAETGLAPGEASLEQTVLLDSEAARLDFDFSVFEVRGGASLADGSSAAGIAMMFDHIDERLPHLIRATSGSDGSFEVRLSPGEYAVHGRSASHAPNGAPGGRSLMEARDTLRVAGHVSDAWIRFGHGLRISGRVGGVTGDELTRLRVEVIGQDLVLREAELDAEYPARYEIAGLGAGSWSVVARVAGADRRAQRTVTLRDHDERIDLEFEALPELLGTVHLDGQPVPGTDVMLLPRAVMPGTDLSSVRRSRTDPDGSFRFPSVPEGRYTLLVGAHTEPVDVAGAAERTLDLRSGRLLGAALDGTTGAPLGGATAFIWPAWAGRATADRLGIVRATFVGEDGGFAFSGLTEGEWLLEVEQVRGSKRVLIHAGSDERITLP